MPKLWKTEEIWMYFFFAVLFWSYLNKYLMDSFHFFHKARPYVGAVQRGIILFLILWKKKLKKKMPKLCENLNGLRHLSSLVRVIFLSKYSMGAFHFFRRTRRYIGAVWRENKCWFFSSKISNILCIRCHDGRGTLTSYTATLVAVSVVIF